LIKVVFALVSHLELEIYNGHEHNYEVTFSKSLLVLLIIGLWY